MSLERWDRFLTELEDTLTADPESLDSAGWVPPEGLGTIPAELEGRARRVLAAQQARIEALEAERSSVARNLTALRSVPARESMSVYLDVTG